MKKFARSFIISLLSFMIVAYIYPGFNFNHDLKVLLLAAGVFAFLSVFIKPFLKMLSLPFNLLTFGLFSFFINVIVLYGVAYFINSFRIVSYNFPGGNFSGFNIPAVSLNQLMSALVASLIIGLISTVMHWVFH